DLPGISVQTELSAGSATGLTDLLIRGIGEPRYYGSLRMDNQGNESTGEYRINGNFGIASPLRRGDRLDASLLVSEEDQLFYQLRYEHPLNARGNSVTLTSSKMAYQLAGEFAALDAEGEARTSGLSLRHVWRRGRDFNLYGDAAYELRKLEDSVSGGALETGKK